jgi:hypothetical protein
MNKNLHIGNIFFFLKKATPVNLTLLIAHYMYIFFIEMSVDLLKIINKLFIFILNLGRKSKTIMSRCVNMTKTHLTLINSTNNDNH